LQLRLVARRQKRGESRALPSVWSAGEGPGQVSLFRFQKPGVFDATGAGKHILDYQCL